MKYLLYCTIFFCFIQISHHTTLTATIPTRSFISLIDDCRELETNLKIRLLEYPYPVFIAKSNSMRFQIENAYKNGKTLIFNITGDKITHVFPAQADIEFKYLQQFKQSPSIDISQLNFNTLNLLDLDQLFKQNFKSIFKISVNEVDLQSCCEIRSGVIACFLSQFAHINSYKLFIKGELTWFENTKIYHWSNHVLTVIPALIQERKTLLIFDPFSREPILNLHTYFLRLKNFGSIIERTYLTDNETLCLNFSSKMGIPDQQFHTSNYLMTQLLRPSIDLPIQILNY